MSDSKEKKTASNRFRKKITPFLAQEMLYDFATGHLDVDRKDAVEEFLKTDKECRNLLEAIHRGVEYSEKLSGTKLKHELALQLMDSENVISLGKK
jgi:anti-sigma factor RsiW